MTEQLYQNFEPDDPLGIIAEQNKGRFLDIATLHYFSSRGISPLNLFQTWVGWSDYVRLDDVVFLPRGGFEFSRYKSDYPAEPALTFVCWDTLGDAHDICAWQPATSKTLRGSAMLLCWAKIISMPPRWTADFKSIPVRWIGFARRDTEL